MLKLKWMESNAWNYTVENDFWATPMHACTVHRQAMLATVQIYYTNTTYSLNIIHMYGKSACEGNAGRKNQKI